MPRPLPRWLFVLIGLVIIVVVGSVVLFSTNVMNRAAVNTSATPTHAMVTITAPTNGTASAALHTPAVVTSKKTVFLIMMENHNWSDIKNNSSAPYIDNTLLPMASYAEQYFNPPGNHPSEPNYVWLEAGTNFGIYNDANPDTNHQGTTKHLVTLLNNAHISWKSYQESISGTICPLTGNGLYATKHNPMVFFNDVTNTNDPNSSYCIAHVRPYTELAPDLQHNTQARYNFITPNLCDDMHDTCAPINDSVKQGDTWLAQNLPFILNSQAYKNGGIVFITWDEGEGGDGPIGMIVLSPDAKGGGYSNTIRYTHSSTLRTLEEIFGVTPLLGDAAHATDLRDLFKTFP
jgi:phosphatidylinositol-3-phosphatase